MSDKSEFEFDELLAAVEEVAEIEQGRKKPARITRYEVADVKALRAKLNVSQRELADALSTSIDTIKSWETGRRNPVGLAAKVLKMLDENPQLFREFVER